MEEIASRLKISAATVSRALRNDQRISEPVRQRVRETAALDVVVERLNRNCLGMGTLPKEVLIKGRWQAGDSLPERPAKDI